MALKIKHTKQFIQLLFRSRKVRVAPLLHNYLTHKLILQIYIKPKIPTSEYNKVLKPQFVLQK